jgi:hypothetical protein
MSRRTRERRRRAQAQQEAVDILVLEIGGAPGKPLPAVRAFLEQHRHTFRPGIHRIVTEHDSGCRYPSGGTCSCVNGPECRIVGLNYGMN